MTQNADIRFLGKLLGDVIREYGGEELFQRIEYIRANSVDRYRGILAAHEADRGLSALSLDDTVAFVRGFMLFSMLANLAEDRQHIPEHSDGELASVLTQLRLQGTGADQVTELLSRALVVPVLTAHPTEVMRKSMLDHRNRIAELLRLRDLGRTETPDADLIETAILKQIALLWQTRALRHERLYVADEVETALAYLREVFLPELPALYARWERLLGQAPPSFLRLGTWIGGDRDGNPNVTAASLQLALGRACATVLTSYLAQVDALGAELSISSELSVVSPRVLELAARGEPTSASRRDEPYRRALTGIYARLAATYTKLTGRAPQLPPRFAAEPYLDPQHFRAELCALSESLSASGNRELAEGGALSRLIRAVEVFGWHLATLDLRQNADVHARVVAELLAVAGVTPDYQSLTEPERVALLRRELGNQRQIGRAHV